MLPYTNSDPAELEPIPRWRKGLAVLLNVIGAVIVLWCMYTWQSLVFADGSTRVVSEIDLLKDFYECAQKYPEDVSGCIQYGRHPGFHTDSDSAYLAESTEGMQSFRVTRVWSLSDFPKSGQEWLRVEVDVVREDDAEQVVWIWKWGQGLTIESAGVRKR